MWLHNDLHNTGLGTLVSTDVAKIGGQSPNTSGAMYSRTPTAKEAVIIKQSQAKIQKSVDTKAAADHPFAQIQEDQNLWEYWEDEEDYKERTGDQDEEEDGQQTNSQHVGLGSNRVIHEEEQYDFVTKRDTVESVQNQPYISDLFHLDDEAEVSLAMTVQPTKHGEVSSTHEWTCFTQD